MTKVNLQADRTLKVPPPVHRGPHKQLRADPRLGESTIARMLSEKVRPSAAMLPPDCSHRTPPVTTRQRHALARPPCGSLGRGEGHRKPSRQLQIINWMLLHSLASAISHRSKNGRFWDGPPPTWFQDDRVTMQSSRLRSVLSPERSPATKGSTMRLRIVASAVAAQALAVSAVGVIGASATQAGAAATGDCFAPPSPGVNWSGCNLAYANLYGANLTNANLDGAYLTSANLTNANLTYANLTGAILRSANLIGTNLTNANLTGANLTGANLRSATLYGTDLSYANLRSANLTGANLTYANLYRTNCSYATWPDGTSDHGRTCPPTPRSALAADDQDTGYWVANPDDGAV